MSQAITGFAMKHDHGDMAILVLLSHGDKDKVTKL
jgi:hypothetical protein